MINNIILLGRLTADVELKKTTSDKSVANFTLAVERVFGKEKVTDFLDCVAWTQTAEFVCKYFKKGDMIGVVGQMTTRDYTTKDGQKRKAYEVLVSQASFCASARKEAAEVPNVEEYVTYENPAEDDGGDLPF